MWPIFRPVAGADTAPGQRPTTTGSEASERVPAQRDLRRNAANVELAGDGGGDERLAVFLQEFDLAKVMSATC